MYHSRIKTGGWLIRDLGAAAVLLEAGLGKIKRPVIEWGPVVPYSRVRREGCPLRTTSTASLTKDYLAIQHDERMRDKVGSQHALSPSRFLCLAVSPERDNP
jgi:hypothetical protein